MQRSAFVYVVCTGGRLPRTGRSAAVPRLQTGRLGALGREMCVLCFSVMENDTISDDVFRSCFAGFVLFTMRRCVDVAANVSSV